MAVAGLAIALAWCSGASAATNPYFGPSVLAGKHAQMLDAVRGFQYQYGVAHGLYQLAKDQSPALQTMREVNAQCARGLSNCVTHSYVLEMKPEAKAWVAARQAWKKTFIATWGQAAYWRQYLPKVYADYVKGIQQETKKSAHRQITVNTAVDQLCGGNSICIYFLGSDADVFEGEMPEVPLNGYLMGGYEGNPVPPSPGPTSVPTGGCYPYTTGETGTYDGVPCAFEPDLTSEQIANIETAVGFTWDPNNDGYVNGESCGDFDDEGCSDPQEVPESDYCPVYSAGNLDFSDVDGDCFGFSNGDNPWGDGFFIAFQNTFTSTQGTCSPLSTYQNAEDPSKVNQFQYLPSSQTGLDPAWQLSCWTPASQELPANNNPWPFTAYGPPGQMFAVKSWIFYFDGSQDPPTTRLAEIGAAKRIGTGTAYPPDDDGNVYYQTLFRGPNADLYYNILLQQDYALDRLNGPGMGARPCVATILNPQCVVGAGLSIGIPQWFYTFGQGARFHRH